jgi:MerR family copper efflux transcriptional regulator
MKRRMKETINEHAQVNAQSTSLKIGEVSRLSGVGIEALRFYEKSGLLDRPSRTSGGYRVFDASILERLDFIKRAQVLGFSLDEIKHVIAEKRDGQSPCAEVRGIVRRRLDELDERMKQMRLYRKELAQALAEWEEAGDTAGHICGLIEGTSIAHPLRETRSSAVKNLAQRRKAVKS